MLLICIYSICFVPLKNPDYDKTIFVYVCIHMHMVCGVHIYVCICEGQGSMLGSSSIAPPYFLWQSLWLDLDRRDLSRPNGMPTIPRAVPCSPSLNSGITGTHSQTVLFVGIKDPLRSSRLCSKCPINWAISPAHDIFLFNGYLFCGVCVHMCTPYCT